MEVVIEKRNQATQVFEAMCETLDLTPSQYEDAEAKYKAVGEWLSKLDSELARFKPKVYAQGSFSLGTCSKPVGRDEFDLDSVCQMEILSDTNQKLVKAMVGKRLEKNGKYKEILEEKNRCWRLNYVGEFHLDVLPAIPDLMRRDNSILIPDRELQCWKESNPLAFAKWFEERMKKVKTFMLESLRTDVQDLPYGGYFLKTPLQRAVQILKRHRDVAFKNKKDYKPASIIITTLAAKAYDGETDLFSGLWNIVQRIPEHIQFVGNVPKVLNPTNEKENFAEKWEDKDGHQLYSYFQDWLKSVRQHLSELVGVREMTELSESMKCYFGEEIIRPTFSRYTEKMEKLRAEKKLHVANTSVMLGSVGMLVKPHTFYGD